jgi:hypothetical protein
VNDAEGPSPGELMCTVTQYARRCTPGRTDRIQTDLRLRGCGNLRIRLRLMHAAPTIFVAGGRIPRRLVAGLSSAPLAAATCPTGGR